MDRVTTPSEIESFAAGLSGVERLDNLGYSFFFVGRDHRLPFVTIAHEGNEFEKVSNLARKGVFRVNIGVSKATFDDLVGDASGKPIDYSALDVFLPHPDYAKQHYVCILNPQGERLQRTKELIVEAHQIALARRDRNARNPEPAR